MVKKSPIGVEKLSYFTIISQVVIVPSELAVKNVPIGWN